MEKMNKISIYVANVIKKSAGTGSCPSKSYKLQFKELKMRKIRTNSVLSHEFDLNDIKYA